MTATTVRRFYTVGTLVKDARLRKELGQDAVAISAGFRNGQFISNVERGLCSVPATKIWKVCEQLKINVRDMKEAMTTDYRENLDRLAGTELPVEMR